MSFLKCPLSPRSLEQSPRTEDSDLPTPSAVPIKRERGRLQRRKGPASSSPSTVPTTSRATRYSERIRNLQASVSRALGIQSSAQEISPISLANPASTELPSSPPTAVGLQGYQTLTPAQQAFSADSPPILPSGPAEGLQSENSFETLEPFPASEPSLQSPPDTIVQFTGGKASLPTNTLDLIPQYQPSSTGTSTPVVSISSPSLSSPPDIIVQFTEGKASIPTNPLYLIPQYQPPTVETSVLSVSTSSPSLLSPPDIIVQFTDTKASVPTNSLYHSRSETPTAATTPRLRKRKSPSIDLELTTRTPKRRNSSDHKHDLSSPTPSFSPSPHLKMTLKCKRKSSSVDLELTTRTSKRRNSGDHKHDLSSPTPSSPPSSHSEMTMKRRRNKLDEDRACSSAAESIDGDSTTSKSSHSLYLDNGLVFESDQYDSQRLSESPSPSPPSPFPPKRTKIHPKQQTNRKKQGRSSRSTKTAAKASTKAPPGQKHLDTNGKEDFSHDDDCYADDTLSDESDYQITSGEREDLLNELTRERGQRLAKTVEIPPDSGLGPVQIQLVRKLATRGCKPVMSRFWFRDFDTWPQSLFSEGDVDSEDEDGELLMFRSQNMSDNYAIKALQELFAVSGRVRDCSFLSVKPQFVVGKAIRQYLHWAIDDAGLKTTRQTIPVHCICPQIPGEEIFSTIMRCSRRLERLGKQHQIAHAGKKEFWPTMIGFVIAGPIVCLLSLDTDPTSEAWSQKVNIDGESPAKYLTQFDLSEREQDVWNSLAVAICVVHLRDTLIKLARGYTGNPAVPIIRGLGNETDDEDI
ncbi:hypothetical protein N7520_011248 [Penicillium odoratum]|uniref:uncharacterized protein n=1 Tax=Penicillium odoratum TaxID=1167516 RepID=UPI0025470058|nr:uncharacterized protein N7520_011248 [Penicillium odoratum]KAJ5746066.1 hypothetical protein N7520_011248 [Penicillium odoratum]